jgi:hypothetical protein
MPAVAPFHQFIGAAISCGGFLAMGVISVGALFGVSRLIEALTRIERPKIVPIEEMWPVGDVVRLPHEAKAKKNPSAETDRGSGAVGSRGASVRGNHKRTPDSQRPLDGGF